MNLSVIGHTIFLIALLAATEPSNARTLCSTALSAPILSPPASEVGFSVRDVSVVFTAEASALTMTISNNTRKSITGLFALAELFDAEGKYQLAITLVAHTTESPRLGSHLGITTSAFQLLESAIPPGEDIQLTGRNDNTYSTCPATMRITALEAAFADRSTFRYAERRWRAPAAVDHAKALDLEAVPAPLPFQAVVDVLIDTNGKASKTTIRGKNVPLRAWFQTQLRSWNFDPAIADGKRYTTTLTLVFRIHAVFDRNDTVSFDDSPLNGERPVIIIDVYPRTDTRGRQQAIVVAGNPVVLP